MMYLYLTSVSLEIFLFLSRFYDLFFPFSSSGEKKKKKKKKVQLTALSTNVIKNEKNIFDIFNINII